MAAVALDSGVVIGALNANDKWHPQAAAFVRTLHSRTTVLSAVAYAECLIRPSADGTAGAVTDALQRLVTVVPTDAVIAALAARIRAEDGVALPDAIVIATAVAAGASTLVTTDKKVASTTRIPTIYLTLSA